MRVKFDKQADAIYIRLTDKPYSYGKDLDDSRRIDYDSNDEPIGIELLGVSHGVITNDLPFRSEIERLLGDRGVKLFA
jgi:uncharacterized protein YuzE